SSSSGYNLILYGTPVSALRITSGQGAGGFVGTIAGTSAVPPLYAGLIAIINATQGRPTGYLNPSLYLIGETPWISVFRDIADGISNSVTFTRPNGTMGTSPGYTSGPGWDACTGWGVPIGTQLQAALSTGRKINAVDSTPGVPAVSVGL